MEEGGEELEDGGEEPEASLEQLEHRSIVLVPVSP